MDPRNRKRNFSRTGVFFTGFLSGVVIIIVIGILGVTYIIKNPEMVMKKAADFGIKQVVVRTMKTVPRKYIAERKDDILESANRFLQAYSQGNLSARQLNTLTQKVFESTADQEITPEEIDDLLNTIHQIVR